jgi:DNA repair protein RecN (Recombination protein N)
MLAELVIHNFAIIDKTEIQLGEGLNALTGETGAGKSILIEALGAVLGDRVSPEFVRAGARSASVDATFDLRGIANREAVEGALAELEIESEDDFLVLSREIQSGGRSTGRINGRPTTASILGQIGSLLVDVHGQSEHLSLLRPAAQLELLDRYAQTTSLRSRFAEQLSELRRVRVALAEARTGARDRMQRIDLIRYQIDEIEQARLRPGEEEELVAERSRLANAERLSRDAATAYEALAGNELDESAGAALPALRVVAQLLDEITGLDPATGSLRERLNDVLFSLEDFAAELRNYRDLAEADPVRLEAVEERLALIRQLKRKYGIDIDEILAHAEAAERELAALTDSGMDTEVLAARETSLASDAGASAAALSSERQKAAARLAADVEQAIAELKMGSAEFVVSLEQVEDRGGIPVPLLNGATRQLASDSTGVDRTTFLIAPNAGEGLKPLNKIASGGETARLMLALKSILSEVDQTPTLVFDEIDVGVGGRSGQVVGEKLLHLSEGHQVIVITHLPQIAAFADRHFRIVKSERGGRVTSSVERLEGGAREEELAAMLGGLPLTESSLRSASEMLERAERQKERQTVAR